MSYENSPACKLIATDCCVCGRDLVDSVSVEAGIGPVCRDKYGYAEVQLEPDWDEYRRLMSDVPRINGWSPSDPPQRLANVITHRIATNIAAPTVRRDILALGALGFSTLAEKLAERVSGALVVEITIINGGLLTLKTPYDPRLIDELRRVRGRRWDSAQKVNTFPATSEPELLDALRRIYFADTFVVRNGRVGTLGEPRKPAQGVLFAVARPAPAVMPVAPSTAPRSTRADMIEDHGLDRHDGVYGRGIRR